MSRFAKYSVLVVTVCVLLLAVGFWLSTLATREPPVRVAGPSMAPGLLGAHFSLSCNDCGIEFSFGVESPPSDGYAVCPNCGAQDNNVSDEQPLSGQQVSIARNTWRVAAPQRWRVVAFRRPGNTRRLNVKRIVGLPGERIAIRGGEVYVDGHRLQKSLQQLRGMAVLVHDNNYRPPRSSSLPSRWSPADPKAGWVENESGGFAYHPSKAASGSDDVAFDWLVYHHWPALPPPSVRCQPSAVHDNFGYNQGESRLLNVVRDLMLHCRLSMPGPGRVSLRVHDGRGAWELRIEADSRKIALWSGGRPIRESTVRATDWVQSAEIELALLDGRILVAINGQTVLAHEVSSSPDATTSLPVSEPLGIGARSAVVEVSEMRIYRDLYFLHPWGHSADWEMKGALSHEQVFVLGDNCPLSNDSRNWEQPGVPLRNVLGYVEDASP